MYVVTAAGITVGFHRMLTHRSFRTHKPTEYVFAVLGSMAVQGPVIAWVADHRKHHAHTDVEGDPHSPHVGHGEGVIGVLRGLWHAHMGWLLSEHGRADWKRYAPDLYEDPGMRLINRRFVSLVVLGLVIPALAGYLITGTLLGAATGLLWGGLVRIFFVHHVTWSVNSVCHFLGSRRFEVEDQLHQRLLARPALAGRVLAPQPPRLPALGRPRPAPLGARPLGSADRRDGEGRPRLERDPDRARAPGRKRSAPPGHACPKLKQLLSRISASSHARLA